MVNRPGLPDESEILERIGDVARRHLSWNGELTPDQSIVETMALDSLRLLTLVVEVENEFRVCLEEGEEHEVRTAHDLVRLIREHLLSEQGERGGDG